MSALELLVVVALLGVMATLALAGARPVARRYRLRDALELAVQFTNEAQARARTSRRCHRVVAFSGGALAAPGAAGDELVVQARPSADCEAAPGGVAWVDLLREQLPSEVSAYNFDDATWTYAELRPNGRVRANTSPTAGLRVSVPGTDALVLVSASGRVCQTSLAAPEPCP